MVASFEEFLITTFWNNTGKDYIIAICILFLGTGLMKLFQTIILSRLKYLAKKTNGKLDDILIQFIEDIPGIFYLFLAFYIAAKFLLLPDLLDTILGKMAMIITIFFLVKAINRVINFLVHNEYEKRKTTDNKENSLLLVFGGIIQAILWIIAFLLVLSNLGVNITSLIAGLGVGGIAIAFALQRILEDIFSSFSIYFDKPFEEGDYVVLGTDSGTVQKIGLKSTRIQTLQGEELVVSNKEMTSARINNYKKMTRRRIVFLFGVEYGTSVAKLKKAKKIIKDIFAKIDLADLDRVHFKSFGDFSLNFEVVYFLNTHEYIKYMDTQEQINLEIKSRFEKEKIEFAFPTQTLLVHKAK